MAPSQGDGGEDSEELKKALKAEREKAEAIEESIRQEHSFYDPTRNPFHAENQDDYVDAQNEFNSNVDAQLSPWDKLVPFSDRGKIEELSPDTCASKCPYLIKPQDPTGEKVFYHFFCGSDAAYLAQDEAPSLGSPWRVPTEGSEEHYARCSSIRLEDFCLENFETCKTFHEQRVEDEKRKGEMKNE